MHHIFPTALKVGEDQEEIQTSREKYENKKIFIEKENIDHGLKKGIILV